MNDYPCLEITVQQMKFCGQQKDFAAQEAVLQLLLFYLFRHIMITNKAGKQDAAVKLEKTPRIAASLAPRGCPPRAVWK